MARMYCVGCRAKKNVTENLVDKVINTRTGRKISMTCGTCPTCVGKVCAITGNKKSSSKRYSVKKVSGSRSAKKSAKRSAKKSSKRSAKKSSKRSAKKSSKRSAKKSSKRSRK
jgi:hypothetical protein